MNDITSFRREFPGSASAASYDGDLSAPSDLSGPRCVTVVSLSLSPLCALPYSPRGRNLLFVKYRIFNPPDDGFSQRFRPETVSRSGGTEPLDGFAQELEEKGRERDSLLTETKGVTENERNHGRVANVLNDNSNRRRIRVETIEETARRPGTSEWCRPSFPPRVALNSIFDKDFAQVSGRTGVYIRGVRQSQFQRRILR